MTAPRPASVLAFDHWMAAEVYRPFVRFGPERAAALAVEVLREIGPGRLRTAYEFVDYLRERGGQPGVHTAARELIARYVAYASHHYAESA